MTTTYSDAPAASRLAAPTDQRHAELDPAADDIVAPEVPGRGRRAIPVDLAKRSVSGARRSVDRARVSLDISGTTSPRAVSWQVLTCHRFALYFAGTVVSNFGTWLQNTAQVILMYQLTHSAFWVGFVTAAQFTMPLLLGSWAGSLTNRLGNWRVLILTQSISLLTSATLATLQSAGVLTRLWLIAGAASIGLAYALALPALSVTAAGLVSPEQTKKALAMDSVSYNLGRALAPALSVLMCLNGEFGLTFALNAVTFGFFLVVLVRLRPARSEATTSRPRAASGLRIALRDRRVQVLLFMVASVTVAADPILVLGPSLARSFGESADWSGFFITALGAGNVAGSLWPSRQAASVRRAAATLAVLSIAMITFVASPSIWLSVAAAAVAGMACLFTGAILRALLLQMAGGPAQQAAIMAAWAVAWAGSKPIASLSDGAMAGLVGFRLTGILLALPALAPAAVLVGYPKVGQRLVRHTAFRQTNQPTEVLTTL